MHSLPRFALPEQPYVHAAMISITRGSKLLLYLAVAPLLLLGSCDDYHTSAPLKPPVELTVVGTGYHYVELELTVTEYSKGDQYSIARNGVVFHRGILRANHIRMIDTLVLPSRRYKYNTIVSRGGGGVEHTAMLYASTRDSSSHDWVFSVETWGSPLCFIHDLLVIDPDTDIWVAGDLNIVDSSGRAIADHTLGHWNGRRWSYYTQPNGGAVGKKFVVQLANGSIFTNRVFMVYDGKTWKSPNFPAGITMIDNRAVRTPDGIHIAGSRGFWYLWDGVIGGTLTRIYPPEPWDVAGMYETGDRVIATLIDPFGYCTKVYSYSQGVFTLLHTFTYGPGDVVSDTWQAEDTQVVAIAGDGARIHEPHLSTMRWNSPFPEMNATTRVRGSASNNIWFSGLNRELIHYNGSTFQSFIFNELPSRAYFGKIWVSDEHLVAVGTHGVVVRGTKSH
jgi:hypothetical protein